MSDPDYTIRELSTISEFQRIGTLCADIWGDDEMLSKDLLIAMRFEGALIAGVTSSASEIVAFLFGFPTQDPAIQHSHIMGVLAAHRNAGLGAKLKWFQRDWCLERGITTVRWTYDPLRAANANLNTHKLGASIGVFLPDYYGTMGGINAGSPSDRLLAEWHLDAPGVSARAAGGFQSSALDLPFALSNTNEHPSDPNLKLTAPRIKVGIPRDFQTLLATQPSLALEWRAQSKLVLEHCFAHQYRITDFSLEDCAYILEREAQQ